MAETQKSIQVNIGVIVDSAKKAMADLATQTKATTDQMAKLGDATQKGAEKTNKSMQEASKSSHGFFSDMQKDIVSSLAAYDLFKRSIGVAFDFFKNSIKESAQASAVMAQVKVNVENAGLSYETTGKQIEEYSKKQIQMGFDDEATALSMSKLILITGDYSKALKLNQLAMDLARSKGIDLETATKQISLVTQGNTKALKEYGIELSDTATISDVLNEAQKKLSGSAQAYSETAQGKLDIVKEQWSNIQQEVGDKLMPTLLKLFDSFEKNLPQITALIGGTVDAIGLLADYIGHVVTAYQEWVSVLNTGMVTEQIEANKVIEQAKKQLQDMADAYNKLHPEAKVTADDLNVNMALMKEAARAFNQLNKSVEENTEKIKVNGKESKQTQQQTEERKQAMRELSQAFIDVTQKQNEFTFKSEQDFARFAKVLQNTKSNQKDWVEQAKQGFSAYSSAIKDVESDIVSLDNKIEAARKSMEDFNKSTISSAGGTFAQIVHDAVKSIPDLEKQLREAQADGQDSTDLQKRLEEAKAIVIESQKSQYNDGTQLAIEYHRQLDLLNRQDSQNQLQIAFETTQQKIAEKQKEIDAVIKGYEETKEADRVALEAFKANQKTMTDIFAKSVKERGGTAQVELSSINAITEAVNRATAAYRAMASARGGGSSSSLQQRASGGPVRGGETYLVGEKGPELFTPSVGGNITANDKVSMGGSLVININNPTVRSDSDLRAIVEMVQNALSRKDDLSAIGAYK